LKALQRDVFKASVVKTAIHGIETTIKEVNSKILLFEITD